MVLDVVGKSVVVNIPVQNVGSENTYREGVFERREGGVFFFLVRHQRGRVLYG